MHDPLENLDLDRLTSMPRLSTKGMAALTRAVLAAKPLSLPSTAAQAAVALSVRLGDYEQAVQRLQRDAAERSPAAESRLDTAVDGVWMWLRGRLLDWQLLLRPGLLALAEDEDAPIEYAAMITRARAAAAVHERLFATLDAAYLRAGYPVQAESLRALLEAIADEPLDDAIAELVDPQVLALLRDLQGRYEAMVAERAARPDRVAAADDLGRHQLAMSRALRRYAAAWVGYYDESPERGAQVHAALLPILHFRGLVERRAVVGEPEPELAAEPEPEPEPALEE